MQRTINSLLVVRKNLTKYAKSASGAAKEERPYEPEVTILLKTQKLKFKRQVEERRENNVAHSYFLYLAFSFQTYVWVIKVRLTFVLLLNLYSARYVTGAYSYMHKITIILSEIINALNSQLPNIQGTPGAYSKLYSSPWRQFHRRLR